MPLSSGGEYSVRHSSAQTASVEREQNGKPHPCLLMRFCVYIKTLLFLYFVLRECAFINEVWRALV